MTLLNRRLSALLLAAGPSSIAGCAGPMTGAVRDNDLKKLDELIAQGADINKPEGGGFCTTPLMYAALNGQADMVKALLKRGADVNRELPSPNGIDGSVLWFAIKPERENVVRILLDAGAQPSPAVMDMVRHGMRHVGIKTMMEETDARLHGRTPPAAAAAPAVEPAPAPAASALSAADIKRIAKAVQVAAPAAATAPAAVLPPSPAPRFSAAERPDDLAIVVGVESYSELPKAAYAERDAEAVKAHLRALGVPERNTILLLGSMASKSGREKNLELWLPRMAKPDSRVYFYFSGHGAPDAKSSAAYLVPADGDPQYLEETAYPIQRLYEKLGALKPKRILVALDSCFSGAGGRSVIASGTRPLVTKLELAPAPSKIVSLSASAAEEISGTLEEQGHGLFTYHLLKALSETAGRGSVAELEAALAPRVQDEAHRQNRAQTPQMSGSSLNGGLR